jgi:hypothetical protein
MWDWLRKILRDYTAFCEAEELRKVKITIKSGLAVPKEGAKAIVDQLQDLQSNNYTKYSDLVRLSQSQKKLETPADQSSRYYIDEKVSLKKGMEAFKIYRDAMCDAQANEMTGGTGTGGVYSACYEILTLREIFSARLN